MTQKTLVIALAFLAILWAGVLPFSDRTSFTVHMVVHMGVVAIAAPLFALALSGSQYDFSSGSAWITPLLASVLELFAVWGWHVPAMRALSETSVVVAAIEQLVFFGAGLTLWLACLGGGTADRKERRLAGVLGLLFTSMHMTLLGALLALAPRPLYGSGEVSCFGVSLTATMDQHAGGVVMLLVGAIVYLGGGIALLAGALEEKAPFTGKLRR